MRRGEDADHITACGASGREVGMVTLLTLLSLVEGGVMLLVFVLWRAFGWLFPV